MAEAAPQTTGTSWTSILGNFAKGAVNSMLQVGSVALNNNLMSNWLPQAQVQQAQQAQQQAAQQRAAGAAAGPSSLAKFAAPIAIGGGAILAAILVFRGKKG
jgi:hypothetical protein